jgi:hypothetical protein
VAISVYPIPAQEKAGVIPEIAKLNVKGAQRRQVQRFKTQEQLRDKHSGTIPSQQPHSQDGKKTRIRKDRHSPVRREGIK